MYLKVLITQIQDKVLINYFIVNDNIIIKIQHEINTMQMITNVRDHI
jgi:hypothetical protein